jgi:hypothetical protein
VNPLLQLLMAQAPSIIDYIKSLHAKQNPDAPPITSAEVLVGLEQLFDDSNSKDEFMKTALKAELGL